jgi:transcriptional regulator with XRE-family HTH domain
MARTNQLIQAPPYAVEMAIKTLGSNIRTARLRRGLSIQEVAERIGANRRVVSDAETGKATTGIIVYFALLWALNLDDQVASIADPATDQEGLALAMSRERTRAPRSEPLNNDF